MRPSKLARHSAVGHLPSSLHQHRRAISGWRTRFLRRSTSKDIAPSYSSTSSKNSFLSSRLDEPVRVVPTEFRSTYWPSFGVTLDGRHPIDRYIHSKVSGGSVRASSRATCTKYRTRVATRTRDRLRCSIAIATSGPLFLLREMQNMPPPLTPWSLGGTTFFRSTMVFL